MFQNVSKSFRISQNFSEFLRNSENFTVFSEEKWYFPWPWRNPRNGSWPWRNPRNGSWPWENPRNDFLAILHSKDQHLLNYMNMNLCCKEEKHLERDHGFSTACLSMTSHYVPVTVD